MRSKLLTVFILLGYGLHSYGQKPQWNNTADWKIYNCFQFSSFNEPVDSLRRYKFQSLNDDTLHDLLDDAYVSETKKEAPVWMGLYTITYTLHSIERKILVSMYGGFFWDATSKHYYQIREDKKQRWLAYFTNLDLSGFSE